MPTQSRRSEIYDALATILANTTQEKIALAAFRAKRNINPKGALYLVKPRVLEDRNQTVKLDAIADQVYCELNKGLPYSKIATHLRVDSRRVRRLKAVWDGLPEFVREDHRKVWARTQRRQANVLEVGRDIGHASQAHGASRAV